MQLRLISLFNHLIILDALTTKSTIHTTSRSSTLITAFKTSVSSIEETSTYSSKVPTNLIFSQTLKPSQKTTETGKSSIFSASTAIPTRSGNLGPLSLNINK